MREFASLIVAALVLAIVSTAAEAKRVALVIGNDRYEHLAALEKAVADAETYAGILESQGFDEVILKTNLTRAETDEALASFFDAIAPGDTAVFAYSGHGWSDGTQNYLVATDAPAGGRQELLARISIPLRNGATGILDDMDRRGAGLKVAIIDACRDNPFTVPAGTRTTSLARGLTRVEPPGGTFVVFSAGTDQQALDRLSPGDPDPNSVFTRVFAPLIRSGLPLQEATKQAQEQVAALARSIKHDQRPAYYDEVLGRACLAGACDTAALPAAAAADDAAADYQAALAQNSAEAWDAFLKYHPDGFYADLARAARQKLGGDSDAPLGFQSIAKLSSLMQADKRPAATASITDCDRMAAIALDPAKPVGLRGLDRGTQVMPGAVDACRAAVAKFPEIGRYKTQLGFALHATNAYDEARTLFEQGVAAGDPVAMFGLSLLYRNGDGVTADRAESASLLERSAAAGFPLARVALAYTYAQGSDGNPADPQRARQEMAIAIPLLEAAAKAGDPDAAAILGLVYLDGEMVDPDAAKAGAFILDGLKRQSLMAIDIVANRSERLPLEIRQAAEQFLADRGLSPGKVDGVIDDATAAALDSWKTLDGASPKVASAAPAAETPAAVERAVLYEEATDGGAGERRDGTARWSFVADGADGPEVGVDLEIPDGGLKIHVAIHKNSDATLPATHLVTVNFGSSPVGGVAGIAPLLLKDGEDRAGRPLAGIAAKVTDNYFMFALSATDADAAANLALLRDGAWIDLPIVMADGRRVIIAFAKGASGERAMAEALAAWGATAKQ